MKFKSIITILTVLLLAGATFGQIEFTPQSLNFHEVMRGDTVWREVTVTYREGIYDTMYVEFWPYTDEYHDRVGCIHPIALDVRNKLLLIERAVIWFRENNHRDPYNFQELITTGYLVWPYHPMPQWEYSLIGNSPVVIIQAVSTVHMPYGEGHIIIYDCIEHDFVGWSIGGVYFLLLQGESANFFVWFAPTQLGTFHDTLEVFMRAGTIFHDFQYLPMVGEGALTIEENSAPPPETMNLLSAYPNPFNSSTELIYSLPFSEEARLSIFNLNGREVARLIEGRQDAGVHTVVWNAGDAPSGLYFARLNSSGRAVSRQIVFIR